MIDATAHPLPVDAAVARGWGRLAAAILGPRGKPCRRAMDLTTGEDRERLLDLVAATDLKSR